MPMFLIMAEDRADDNRLSVYFCQAKNTSIARQHFDNAEYTEGLTISQIVAVPTLQMGRDGMIPWETVKDGDWREKMLAADRKTVRRRIPWQLR